jgi:hypothetical protein
MPFGQFLDAFPSLLFVIAHVVFIAVGLWAIKKLNDSGARYAKVLWLYPISQIFFLVFFAGASTMKLAVLLEQSAMVALVALIAMRNDSPAS